ncbi:hypothetical protein MKZ01_10670 [Lysinibacillus endophyticus]
MMFIQTLFKQERKDTSLEKTPADKLLEIILTLLNKELPQHQSQHHILFTANSNLEYLKNLLNYHRKQINPDFHTGQYHQNVYAQLQKQISQLQMLVDGYMELSIDIQQMNHRLHFHHDAIHYLYNNYKQTKEQNFYKETEPMFWQCLKEDVLEIIKKML